jgi:hypothetical protein
MSQTILFDGDHVEQLAEVTERPRRLKESELLWVDVDRESERDVRRIAEALEIDDRRSRRVVRTFAVCSPRGTGDGQQRDSEK